MAAGHRSQIKAQIDVLAQISTDQVGSHESEAAQERRLDRTPFVSDHARSRLRRDIIRQDRLTALFTFSPRHQVAVTKIVRGARSNENSQPERPAEGGRPALDVVIYWSYGRKATAKECQKVDRIREAFLAHVQRDEITVSALVATVLSACCEAFVHRCEEVAEACSGIIPNDWDAVQPDANFMRVDEDSPEVAKIFQECTKNLYATTQAEARSRGMVFYFNMIAFDIRKHGKLSKVMLQEQESRGSRAGAAAAQHEDVFQPSDARFNDIHLTMLRLHDICEHPLTRHSFDPDLCEKLFKLDELFFAIDRLSNTLRHAIRTMPPFNLQVLEISSHRHSEQASPRSDAIAYLQSTLLEPNDGEDEETARTMNAVIEHDAVTLKILRDAVCNPDIPPPPPPPSHSDAYTRSNTTLMPATRTALHPELALIQSMLRQYPRLHTLYVSTSHVSCLWCQIYLDELGNFNNNEKHRSWNVLHLRRRRGSCPRHWLPPPPPQQENGQGIEGENLEAMLDALKQLMALVRWRVKELMYSYHTGRRVAGDKGPPGASVH